MATKPRTQPENPELHDAALQRRFGLQFTIAYMGKSMREREGDHKAWACLAWRYWLKRTDGSGAVMEGDYFTGTGLPYGPHPGGVVYPPMAGVLQSLLLDASCAEGNFLDYCDECGASADSLQALNTYLACCRTARDLRKLLDHAHRQQLAELLQDY